MYHICLVARTNTLICISSETTAPIQLLTKTEDCTDQHRQMHACTIIYEYPLVGSLAGIHTHISIAVWGYILRILHEAGTIVFPIWFGLVQFTCLLEHFVVC